MMQHLLARDHYVKIQSLFCTTVPFSTLFFPFTSFLYPVPQFLTSFSFSPFLFSYSALSHIMPHERPSSSRSCCNDRYRVRATTHVTNWIFFRLFPFPRLEPQKMLLLANVKPASHTLTYGGYNNVTFLAIQTNPLFERTTGRVKRSAAPTSVTCISA